MVFVTPPILQVLLDVLEDFYFVPRVNDYPAIFAIQLVSRPLQFYPAIIRPTLHDEINAKRVDIGVMMDGQLRELDVKKLLSNIGLTFAAISYMQ